MHDNGAAFASVCERVVVHLDAARDVFTTADLTTLVERVASTWSDLEHADWTVPADAMSWSCLATADHAVDCVYAPAFFLASRRTDRYPVAGGDLRLRDAATPALLVESLWTATRLLVGIVESTPPSTVAVIFRRPSIVTGVPADFPARAALELALHAHDVARGLGAAFAPPPPIAGRLRRHTTAWPLWGAIWEPLRDSGDPWHDLLTASGRRP